jgi:hypothetical protein
MGAQLAFFSATTCAALALACLLGLRAAVWETHPGQVLRVATLSKSAAAGCQVNFQRRGGTLQNVRTKARKRDVVCGVAYEA